MLLLFQNVKTNLSFLIFIYLSLSLTERSRIRDQPRIYRDLKKIKNNFAGIRFKKFGLTDMCVCVCVHSCAWLAFSGRNSNRNSDCCILDFNRKKLNRETNLRTTTIRSTSKSELNPPVLRLHSPE